MLNSTNKAGSLFLQNISSFKNLIFLAVLLVNLSCSTITNTSQSTSRQIVNDNDLNLLKNTSNSNLSYIGEDGNIWITDENKELRITDFSPNSKELPISFYHWSPDGRKIALQANNGVYIFLLSAQTIEKHFLGKNSFLSGHVSQHWSPDSKNLLTTQLGFKTLELIKLNDDGTLEKKSVIEPLSHWKNMIWLPDSINFLMSEKEYVNVETENSSGLVSRIKLSILDTQTLYKTSIYEGWGTSFDVFSNKVVLIGGDEPHSLFPIIYDIETSETTKFDKVIPESSVCFGDHRNNIAIFTVSKNIDASQSILLIDTSTMSYNNIEFGEISKLTDFKSGCTGYVWGKDKQTLFFNSDVFWGGEILHVNTQSNKIHPFAGDKNSEPQFVFDLPNAQVVDILDDGNMLASGVQNGQINALYYVNIETSQMQRVGDEAFWAAPSYFGQSQSGLLVIQATDIQTQLTNIYLIDTNGNVVKTINNASQPIWQSAK
jgi:sugar lactone lactonase YvrE